MRLNRLFIEHVLSIRSENMKKSTQLSNQRMRGGLFAVAIAAVALFAGCDNPAGGSTDDPRIVAVERIARVPSVATVGMSLALSGTVQPASATNKTITWSIKEDETDETTGARIETRIENGDTLETTGKGKVTVTATIVNGAGQGRDFIDDFQITIRDFISVNNIKDVPVIALAT